MEFNLLENSIYLILYMIFFALCALHRCHTEQTIYINCVSIEEEFLLEVFWYEYVIDHFEILKNREQEREREKFFFILTEIPLTILNNC